MWAAGAACFVAVCALVGLRMWLAARAALAQVRLSEEQARAATDATGRLVKLEREWEAFSLRSMAGRR